VIATAMRMVGDKGVNGNGGRSNGNSDKGGRQATAVAMKRAMALATRVTGGKEGNGNKGDG
jgi:hypothetical protein